MLEKLKNMFNFNKEGMTNKKKIENLVFLLVLLVIVVIIINFVLKTPTKENKNELNNTVNKYLASNGEITSNSNNISNTPEESNTTYNLQDELQNTLSKISGVRKSSSFTYI
jgi:transposase